MQKRKKDTTNLDESVAKVNVPTLPEFNTEIYLDQNEMESIIGDDITVSVADDKTTNNEIKDKQQKIESEISKLIDLFKLPEYQNTRRRCCHQLGRESLPLIYSKTTN